MDFDRLPSRPVVVSTVSAQAEWEHWLLENHFQRLLDGDGLDWNLEIDVQQLPDDQDRHSSRWIATLYLKADVNAEMFITTGTIDADDDQRLIALIGDRDVPLRMKPVVHEARGEKDAKDMLVRILPELRENIAKSKMRDIKRGLICRWIDEQAAFGVREHGRGW